MAVRQLQQWALGALFGLAASSAMATVPPTSVSWIQQTGTALNTDVVDIWVRLSVDSSATEALYLDGSQTVDLPPDWMSLGVYNVASASCSTTFFPQAPLSPCYDPASPYVFSFNYGSDTFIASQAAILPGESRDFFFGSFTPQNGPVAPGLYSFSNASLEFFVDAVDGNGDAQSVYVSLGDTCGSFSDSCAFTREITAVPEPESVAMLAMGLMAVGWYARRRG